MVSISVAHGMSSFVDGSGWEDAEEFVRKVERE